MARKGIFKTVEIEYGKEVDIWSVGIIMYELAFGKYPTQKELKSRIFDSCPSAISLSPGFHKTLAWILSPEPKNRPLAKDLIKSEYFKEVGAVWGTAILRKEPQK
jgi:serine/threonine protein kinase